MAATKAERNKKDSLGLIPSTIGGKVLNEYVPNSPEMPLKRMAELSRQSKNYYTLFQPALNAAKAAYPLLLNVVKANLDGLKNQVRANPELFFKKGQITDLDGQTFYNVSPYQLITFLCDDDMKRQIMPLIPRTFRVKRGALDVEIPTAPLRKQQYAEIDSGGADLVKMDRDPTTLQFEEVTRFITRYRMYGRPTAVTFPLLENPDGIIYYREPQLKLVHLYYVNQKTQTIKLLRPKTNSIEEQRALIKFYASFVAMENNSSRRSSNAEHELIAHTMQHQLSRKGIQYVHKGIHYCDSRMEFRLINAYRKNIRLYQKRDVGDGDDMWCRGVGEAQRQVLWVLQRLCESGRPFYPIPDFNEPPFRRGFTICNYHTGAHESVCSAGGLVRGLGSDFAIYKRGGSPRAGLSWWWGLPEERVPRPFDLVAVNRLIEDAKASVVEFTPGRENTSASRYSKPFKENKGTVPEGIINHSP
jgi:hypothetical protein